MKSLKPTDLEFIDIFCDPKRGNGDATKTVTLLWPDRYKGYKKDQKIRIRASVRGHRILKKLNLSVSDALDRLGFNVLKRAQYALGLLSAKKIIRDSSGRRVDEEPDNYIRAKVYENISRICGDNIIRHEITTPEGMEPKIKHELDFTALSDKELMEGAKVIGLKPEQMLAAFIKVGGSDAEQNEQQSSGESDSLEDAG